MYNFAMLQRSQGESETVLLGAEQNIKSDEAFYNRIIDLMKSNEGLENELYWATLTSEELMFECNGRKYIKLQVPLTYSEPHVWEGVWTREEISEDGEPSYVVVASGITGLENWEQSFREASGEFTDGTREDFANFLLDYIFTHHPNYSK